MTKLIFFIKWLIIIITILAVAIWAFMTFHPVWGGKPDSGSLKKIQASKQFNQATGQFENYEPTQLLTSDRKPSISAWIAKMFTPEPNKNPSEPLPTVPFNQANLKNGSVAWFGHSTVIFKLDNQTFITDPVFHNASPVPFIGINPFKMTNPPKMDDLSNIDVALLSHDHYDHLDYRAIQELDSKIKHFIVPLGVKAHLQRWGVADEKITELDWNEQTKIGHTVVTLVPSRHFSGRTLNVKNPTLWGGFVIQAPDLKYYFSADSGYGKHYKEVIAKHAPFDFVMIENGAYDDGWAQIHEMPEQTLQALTDIQAKKALPIHWAKFDMANHAWKQPIERLMADAKKYPEIQFATPKIGQIFQPNEPLPQEKWWENVK